MFKVSKAYKVFRVLPVLTEQMALKVYLVLPGMVVLKVYRGFVEKEVYKAFKENQYKVFKVYKVFLVFRDR